MRLIDADKLLQEKWKVETKDMWHMTVIEDVVSTIDIEKAPTVDAEPVRHGHWVEAKYPLFTCSECGAIYQDTGYGYNYCPNCGAKMDGERK